MRSIDTEALMTQINFAFQDVYLFDGTIEENVRLGRPRGVLLDDVTSALDLVNEAAVHDGVERLMTGRTVVMVAHRPRTVQRADRAAFVVHGSPRQPRGVPAPG